MRFTCIRLSPLPVHADLLLTAPRGAPMDGPRKALRGRGVVPLEDEANAGVGRAVTACRGLQARTMLTGRDRPVIEALPYLKIPGRNARCIRDGLRSEATRRSPARRLEGGEKE